MMNKYGLIGYPLSHSFSPDYFKAKFEQLGISSEYEYHSYPLASLENGLSDFLKLGLRGFNITIPYKEQIIPFLDELSPESEAMGAVNTVLVSNGYLKGFNTDVYGFEYSLRPMLQEKAYKALILGTGGASKAVAYVFRKMNIPHLFVSRGKGNLIYNEIDRQLLEEYTIIVNTTPLGMYPNIDQCPALPYEDLSGNHLLYDLVYNPEKSLFLKRGEAQGAAIKNGLHMLRLQADKAWDIWNHK